MSIDEEKPKLSELNEPSTDDLSRKVLPETPEPLGSSSGSAGVSEFYENDLLDREERHRRHEIDTQGRREYYYLRKKWSWALLVALISMLLFQFILCWRLGLGKWDYQKYPTFLHLQTVEFFGQIFLMCIVVVKFLFREPERELKEPKRYSKDARSRPVVSDK